jgi:hypothetical protein
MLGIEKIEPRKHLFELICPKSTTLDEVQPAENNGGLCIDVPHLLVKNHQSLRYA